MKQGGIAEISWIVGHGESRRNTTSDFRTTEVGTGVILESSEVGTEVLRSFTEMRMLIPLKCEVALQ